ncbi:alpha/beta hydrolase [Chryseobacterium indologenes]|uniref:alpha/beta fold hydrolase n=1 Tax=Chryseobacterium indologenes TaxID=253 RepID=UPI000F4F341C|nr:alpha/beta hydrolase [Chryseobacterium indologenes]AYZ35935.1 alpha/beta hydrolase [Chryseobacterium indologenes]MBF6644720.1 alpha/beta hydrolase [Chryseobacterium indologenes]MBU3048832.1 alpha/beta hydrolase [Chryseobacterium indologenes]MEB4759714.1 alpha/beta hydrolase [Chryseobacterium indologenes]QQQ71588.1 alpha/beta hydrolase [Chryseobacterium indologenes]
MNTPLNFSKKIRFVLSFVIVMGLGLMSLKAQTYTSEDVASAFTNTKKIRAGLLDVGYAEVGPENGKPVILLHGWPYDIHSFEQSSAILAEKGYRVLVPYLRGYGTTTFVSQNTKRNGQQSVVALDIIAFMDALKIHEAIIGGFDWGARTADIIAALWPERCSGLVAVSGYLIGSPQANEKPLSPNAEFLWWYQYYFSTERGYKGYKANTEAFNKLIWKTASPKWTFDDATYERSSKAFNNPDHIDIVIHNYRWRLGLAKGEKQYDIFEAKLAKSPSISVPTVTLEGDANGAAYPSPESYASKFTGTYTHHTLTGGIGHNLPQEAPKAFADAIVEVDGMSRSIGK